MAKQRINLTRVVYNKNDYQKTIDTSFNELLPIVPEEEIDTITVEQFFEYYNDLFFDIPKLGELSHNTLIQQSTEYVGDQQTNDELEALVEEVNSLRGQLLEAQTELADIKQQSIENIDLSQISTPNNG